MVSAYRLLRLLCVFTLLTGSACAAAATVAEAPPLGGNADRVQSHIDRFQNQTIPRPHSLSSNSPPSLRLRSCLGVDPTCIGGGIQADLSGDALGFSFGLSVFPLVVIPIPSLNTSLRAVLRHRSDERSGMYGYVGGSLTMIFFPVFAYGGGVGWEVESGRKRQLLLQPQVGLSMIAAPGGTDLSYSPLLPFPLPTASVSFVRDR
jgi:hypothetical protein